MLFYPEVKVIWHVCMEGGIVSVCDDINEVRLRVICSPLEKIYLNLKQLILVRFRDCLVSLAIPWRGRVTVSLPRQQLHLLAQREDGFLRQVSEI